MDQQGQIYDPVSKRGVTVEEAQQLIAQRKGGGTLSVANPMNPSQSVGVSLPPIDEQSAADILKAFPQIAGFLANLVPAGKGAMATSIAAPAAVELVRQAFEGEDADMSKAATQGAMGGVARLGGGVFRAIGSGGKDMVKRSLNLGSTPFAYNETAEEMLPALALKERASMTKAGVDTVRKKAQNTGLGGLEDLTEVLSKGRFDAENAPLLSGGGIMSTIASWLNNPKQLKLGQAVAQPFGIVDTEKTVAPSVEAILRAVMASLSANQGQAETRRRQP